MTSLTRAEPIGFTLMENKDHMKHVDANTEKFKFFNDQKLFVPSK